MDYGHPLTFGVHLSHPTRQAVETGALAERLGLNYLSIGSGSIDGSEIGEDAHLEHWTLASQLAARTGSIMLRTAPQSGANPVVIARSAASLDLLSGARTDLALPLLSGTQLDELTTILGGIWDSGTENPLTFHGRHYSIPAAQRGPAPAHRIPLWVTGISDDSLRAAGQLADGWVVQYADLPATSAEFPAALNALNDLAREVDTHAITAGRDPREVRRQVVVKQEDLLGFVERDLHAARASVLALVDAGFAEFLFDTNDSDLLTWIATDLAPAVADDLTHVREEAGTRVGVMRNAGVRARRIGAIDYDSIPSRLQEVAVEPGDPHHAHHRNTYLRGGNPGVVLLARDTQDVRDAVTWAASQNVPFAVRSGGHGFSGRSTNNAGIVLSLRGLRDVTVLDPEAGLVRVEPGAQWAEVARALEPHGLAISSGDSGTVGVGGLATVGGIGFFAKEHGLTIDYIEALEIVTASGDVVRASRTENPELFWGMRGAGPNFGVVTSFEFQAQKTGLIAHVQLAFQTDDLATFLYEYGQVVEETPDDTTLFLLTGGARRGQPSVVQLYGVVNSADRDTILARLQPFADLGQLVNQQVYLTTYAGAIGEPATGAQHGHGEPLSRAGALPHITREAAHDLAGLIHGGLTGFFQIRTTGGAAGAVPEDATAYSGRANTFHVVALGNNRARLEAAWSGLSRHFTGYYLNLDTDTNPERIQGVFSAEKWERLVALKREWDPGNLFNDNFNIAP